MKIRRKNCCVGDEIETREKREKGKRIVLIRRSYVTLMTTWMRTGALLEVYASSALLIGARKELRSSCQKIRVRFRFRSRFFASHFSQEEELNCQDFFLGYNIGITVTRTIKRKEGKEMSGVIGIFHRFLGYFQTCFLRGLRDTGF